MPDDERSAVARHVRELDRLSEDLVVLDREIAQEALEDPAVKKRIEDTGSLVIGNTPDQFAAQIKAEFDVYKQVVVSQKLKLD